MYDLHCTPEQLKAAAAWAEEGENVDHVALSMEGEVLVISQGDDQHAFDRAGHSLGEFWTPRHV